MHRSVLQNRKYIAFSKANSVEVIAMEEIDRAVEKKAATIATYKAQDAYGDEEEYLVEFPGLTLDELKDLSSTDAVVSFMEGGRIPYTAIVDPHTGKAMEGIKGKPTVASLSTAVLRARKVLEEKHGKGVPRKQWEKLGAAEVRIDLLAISGKYGEALRAYDKATRLIPRPPRLVKNRLEVMREVLLKDVGKFLDLCAKDGKLRVRKRAELRAIANAVGDPSLAKRAEKLAKPAR